VIPVSFDGVAFSGRGLGYGLIRALPGEERAPIWRMRRGGDPAATGMTRGARLIRIQFYNPPEGGEPDDEDIEARLLTLLGELDLTNDEPRPLVVELTTDDDGDGLADTDHEVTVDAVIGAYAWLPGNLKGIEVTFHVVSGLWDALTATTVGPATVAKASYGGLAPTIGGTAPAYGTVRLEPTAADQQVTVRTFSITNNGDRTMQNFPVRVDLGNTYDGLPHSPYYFALLKDGLTQRCQLVNYYGRNIAYVWLVVDHLPPGETADYTLLLSDTYLMPGTAFNSYTQPAFDTQYEVRTVVAGPGGTTAHNISGVSWETNQCRGGVMRALTGTQAGVEREITASTAGGLTTAAFPGAVAGGESVLLIMSSNGTWVYSVRQTERNDSRRGLWWVNQGQKKPGDARFDVPGAWGPYLYVDNDDVKNQSSWFGVNVGTFDYFASLDADRSFPGGSSLQDNGADGVSITMPFPMTGLRFTYQLKNPNGMATFVVGSREAGGAADFIHEYTDTAQLTTLTNRSEQNLTLTADTIQLYLGLIPTTVSSVVQEEIGAAWAGDEGTATSGSTTTLTDSTKDWIPDQFIGGSVRIVSGTGAGQEAAITDNSATQLTASFTTAPDNTSRYVIRQKWGLVATARTNDRFELTWDASDLTISAVSSPASGYLLNRTLYLDRATSSADPPYQRIQFDPDDTERYIVLLAGETFVIDGEEQRAWIEDSGGDEVRAVPPYAVRVHDVEADGTERLAERWLWLTPGSHTLNLSAEADGNEYEISLTYTEAFFG
jgi:hypothetical protein